MKNTILKQFYLENWMLTSPSIHDLPVSWENVAFSFKIPGFPIIIFASFNNTGVNS